MEKCKLIFLMAIVFLAACKREVIPVDEVDLGKEYFPLKEGKYIEYQVDSLVYNDFTKDTDFVQVEFRDEIKSTFLDNEGRSSYAVERSIRYNATQNWGVHEVYYITETPYRIEVVENNLRFIKMVFPVKANISWKGNIYIPALTSGLDEIKWYYDWDYKYKTINEAFNNGLVNFPNSTSVAFSRITNDTTSTTGYNDFTNHQEVYAKNVGLVYRELTHWEYQPTQAFRKGFSITMRAKNYN